MKLFELNTRRKGSQVIVFWDPNAASSISSWESMCPSDLPMANWTNFLKNVGLSGPIDFLVWDLFLLPVFRHSSSVSTELHLSNCYAASQYAWTAFLNGLWHLPHLSTVRVASSIIPDRMYAIPQQTIQPTFSGSAVSATWMLPPPDAPTGPFLPNLRTLSGTINLLLLFDEAELRFPKLIDLTIQESPFHEPPTSFFDLTRVFGYIASYLPQIQILTLDIPYSGGLSAWLESVSKSKAPSPRHAPLAIFIGALRQVRTLNLSSPGRQYPSSEHVDTYALHPKSVALFMARLPGLRTAVLTGLFNVPLEAVATEQEFWQGIRGMWGTCHKMEELKIYGIGQRGTQGKSLIWKRHEAEPTPGIESYSQYFIPPGST